MMIPIFFIPGTLCDQRLWSELWPLLDDAPVLDENYENSSQVLKSTGVKNSYQLIHLSIARQGSMQEVVMDLVEQVKALSAGRIFYLIGFSLGGYLASAVSLHCNHQLQKLMIIANTPMALPLSEIKQRQQIINTVAEFGYAGLNRARVLAFIDDSQHHNDALIELIQMMDQHFNQQDLMHHLGALSEREDLCEALQSSKMDVSFCFGENDHLVDRSRLLTMQDNTAQIHVERVASCGHFLPLENPRKLAEIINKWLAISVDQRN